MSKYSRHLAKILSPFPNKVFPDKGTLILPVSLNVRLILLINYFKLLTDIQQFLLLQFIVKLKVHNIKFTTSLQKNAGYTDAKTATKHTKMQLFVTFSFAVSGCNIIRVKFSFTVAGCNIIGTRKFEVQKQKINIELLLKISVE